MKDFIRENPDLYAKNCHGVREIYLQRIRDSAMVKPVSEWHFGHTRSGKTYAGLDSVGGMNNPDCHYQQGNLDWIKGNYMGEAILFLNEYRHSNMEAFTNLLTILEGYRAEMPMKGSFVPIRAQRVIITCPRPPQALTIMGPYGPETFGGEFESIAKNSTDNTKVAWEDAAQVTERIVESGGKIIYHYRHQNAGVWEYFQLDVTEAALKKARNE